MIKPTIGRVVWYRPSPFDYESMTIHALDQPLAAIVAYVWSDTLVNLTVSDHAGATHARTSVYLDQAGDGCQSSPYCEWMPYQKGQAAKTDAAEAKADAAALDVSALAYSARDLIGGAVATRLPAGTPIAEGFTETGPAEPIGAQPIDPKYCFHAAIERDYKTGPWFRCIGCGMTAERVSDFDTDSGLTGRR